VCWAFGAHTQTRCENTAPVPTGAITTRPIEQLTQASPYPPRLSPFPPATALEVDHDYETPTKEIFPRVNELPWNETFAVSLMQVRCSSSTCATVQFSLVDPWVTRDLTSRTCAHVHNAHMHNCTHAHTVTLATAAQGCSDPAALRCAVANVVSCCPRQQEWRPHSLYQVLNYTAVKWAQELRRDLVDVVMEAVEGLVPEKDRLVRSPVSSRLVSCHLASHRLVWHRLVLYRVASDGIGVVSCVWRALSRLAPTSTPLAARVHVLFTHWLVYCSPTVHRRHAAPCP
jgi:hypothetical protein